MNLRTEQSDFDKMTKHPRAVQYGTGVFFVNFFLKRKKIDFLALTFGFFRFIMVEYGIIPI